MDAHNVSRTLRPDKPCGCDFSERAGSVPAQSQSQGLFSPSSRLAPLLFARNAIAVTVHFHIGAVGQEELGLGARFHLRAMCSAITTVARSALAHPQIGLNG
jgi:hypothetical protein